MKRLLIGFITLVALTTSACVIDSAEDSTLTVINDSSYIFDEMYIAELDAPSWGFELLGPDGLFPGESITFALDCGTYDALIVDEVGAECTLLSESLCFDDATWVVDDLELALCSF